MVVVCFLQVFRSSNYEYIIGKKGRRFQLCYQFLAVFLLGQRYGNGPNELVHRVGPPFLDNHYRGHIVMQFTFQGTHVYNIVILLWKYA